MDSITLINGYVEELLKAEGKFFEDLGEFSTYEQTVTDMAKRMATAFIGNSLTMADKLIRGSGIRKNRLKTQRVRSRSLVSGVGDITFERTLYMDKNGKICCPLDRLIHLPAKERGRS